jgi:hypothetical protein
VKIPVFDVFSAPIIGHLLWCHKGGEAAGHLLENFGARFVAESTLESLLLQPGKQSDD